MDITKLIVTLAALWILAPAVALAGNAGGDDYQYEQNTAPKVIVNVPAQPPTDNSGAIIAACVAGAFSLAGVLVLRNKKS